MTERDERERERGIEREREREGEREGYTTNGGLQGWPLRALGQAVAAGVAPFPWWCRCCDWQRR